MYLVGADHPNKHLAIAILERLTSHGERLVTDAEVFQEILHRYSSIRRTEAIQPAFDLLLGIVDDVFAVNLECVENAKGVLLAYEGLSSRDAIHVGTMKAHQISTLVSFDAGFDVIPGLTRLMG